MPLPEPSNSPPFAVIVPVPDVEILPDVEIAPEPDIDPNTFNESPDGNCIPPSAVINPDAVIAPHPIAPDPRTKDVPVRTPVEEIEPVFAPFLIVGAIIFPNVAVIFPDEIVKALSPVINPVDVKVPLIVVAPAPPIAKVPPDIKLL